MPEYNEYRADVVQCVKRPSQSEVEIYKSQLVTKLSALNGILLTFEDLGRHGQIQGGGCVI